MFQHLQGVLPGIQIDIEAATQEMGDMSLH